MIRSLCTAAVGAAMAAAAMLTGYTAGAFTAGPAVAASTPHDTVVRCTEHVDSAGNASIGDCHTIRHTRKEWRHAARVCAASTLTADDYAHTHTRPAHYRRTIRACARAVGGF